MSSQVLALRVGGTIFGLMALARLAGIVIFLRLGAVGPAPRFALWLKLIGLVILGGLAVWQWKVSYTTEKK